MKMHAPHKSQTHAGASLSPASSFEKKKKKKKKKPSKKKKKKLFEAPHLQLGQVKGDNDITQDHSKQSEQRDQIGREPQRQKLGRPAPEGLKDVVGQQRMVFAMIRILSQMMQFGLVGIRNHAPHGAHR
jgi:hypothetical protein